MSSISALLTVYLISVTVTPDSPPEAAQIPSFKTTVHFMRKRFITVIQLHNIPDKHIDLEVTPTHFSLNTFKYSKKFFLKYVSEQQLRLAPHNLNFCLTPLFCRFRYPTKIKVDENDVEVDLSGGVLTVTLKIVQILNEETGKLMAFKGKTKSSGQPSATKKSAPKPESSSEEMDVSEDGAEESEDEQVSEEEEEKPKRKSKAPTTVRPTKPPSSTSSFDFNPLLRTLTTVVATESQRAQDFGRSCRCRREQAHSQVEGRDC